MLGDSWGVVLAVQISMYVVRGTPTCLCWGVGVSYAADIILVSHTTLALTLL